MKKAILQVCEERNDTWAKEVEFRILSALSDLHSVDARYHRSCKPAFMCHGAIHRDCNNDVSKDIPFENIVHIMNSDRQKLWSSVEIYNMYADFDGTKLQQRSLVEAISKYFGDQILVLSGKGIASLIVFRFRAAELVQLDDETDLDDGTIKAVAKQWRKDHKHILLQLTRVLQSLNVVKLYSPYYQSSAQS